MNWGRIGDGVVVLERFALFSSTGRNPSVPFESRARIPVTRQAGGNGMLRSSRADACAQTDGVNQVGVGVITASVEALELTA